MSDIQLRKDLLTRVDAAICNLADQVQNLLQASLAYCDGRVITTQAGLFKAKELNILILDLNATLQQLLAQVLRWKRGEQSELSQLGIEVQILNECYVTMRTMTLFFITEQVDLGQFSLTTVTKAYEELLLCNRLL